MAIAIWHSRWFWPPRLMPARPGCAPRLGGRRAGARDDGGVDRAGPALLLHDWALPILFYGMVSIYLGAVLKRHFGHGETAAVRRMLR